ncbi:DUF6461 domain-containing protein (plasmid) [Streptomyces poriferorum]|uniref:DUF6461 domain-containing protein n=1 Tax=Streptomyces poriferorum TaxID=2798799 RepID=UPI00273DB3BB|nr:DUF6461 domain-containing protein [Streptomyces sp. Alt1]WLQ53885.1 DUF6461 domain-containing protein [Streptomyces sp. Alt1]
MPVDKAAASNSVNINGLDSILWAQDTAGRLTFEPAAPDRRWGTTPDELLEAMRHCGFQLWNETSATAEHLAAEAAFALAEHLTGVRITPELLQNTPFNCGSAQIRRANHGSEQVLAWLIASQGRATAITMDAHGHVDNSQAALDRLLDRLADTPTPAGPTPRELDLPATARLLPLVDVRQGGTGTAPR